MPSGRVQVMDRPPEILHFSATIVTYREYQRRRGEQVVDELFRLLLLSLLEEAAGASPQCRSLPSAAELARGLTDTKAPVRYDSQAAANYPLFRSMIDQMCQANVLSGRRASAVREALAPFDAKFAGVAPAAESGATPKLRQHGLARAVD